MVSRLHRGHSSNFFWITNTVTLLSSLRLAICSAKNHHHSIVTVVGSVSGGSKIGRLLSTSSSSSSIIDQKNRFTIIMDRTVLDETSQVWEYVKPSSSSSSTTVTENGSNDTIPFDSLAHPGYARQSDEVSYAGGWLAHRLPDPSSSTAPYCWIRDSVAPELTRFDYETLPLGRAPRVLVLYGSLRSTSFSRKTAYEFARLLETLGCDVRTYNPRGLPVRDPALEDLVKVRELRALTQWSDGHVWVSPEMHGTITGTFKNQIDWIPLNTGSVRPTQGKTCLVAQVNGGSQSFNAVNALRLLARWMRMPCCTNQSSVAKAWQEFDDATGRMKDSSFRDRVVDCAEEFAKFTAVLAPVSDDLTDRYSERKEKAKEGKLLTQAEKELQKTVAEARKS